MTSPSQGVTTTDPNELRPKRWASFDRPRAREPRWHPHETRNPTHAFIP